MKLHRFIGDYNISKKEVEILDPKVIKQIKDVLRIQINEEIVLCDGKGRNALVLIENISPDKILCSIKKLEIEKSFGTKTNLYLAILKKENFELAVQKAVEVGVTNITPIITERTIKTGINITRMKKIILEASEQCGRSIVPVLSPILDFPVALAYGSASQEKIIFHIDLKNNLYTPDLKAKNVSIFIGPEGGFTEKEIKQAENASYTVASLGPLVLRGETAAIVATYRAVSRI